MAPHASRDFSSRRLYPSMKRLNPHPTLFLVTDPAYTDAHIVDVVHALGKALPSGKFGVQLRDKRRGRETVRVLAERLRDLTTACQVPFVVNGDVALALEVGADGVHLGGDSPDVAAARRAFARGWISVAAHSDRNVLRASDQGADAILVSPIYATPGKGAPRGLAALGAARALGGSVAIYALGGIDASRAKECASAGARGVAVVRALLDAKDPVGEAEALLAAFPQSPEDRLASRHGPDVRRDPASNDRHFEEPRRHRSRDKAQ
jgi:thiamine-phosphate pyrophosphorylase